MMLIKLAWRNIWRNRRRTILTTLAITFGIVLTVVTRALQFGVYAQTIDYNIGLSVGHLQVHRNGYWDKQTLRYAFPLVEADTARIAAMPYVVCVSPKLAVDALVGVGTENTAGARLMGIIPSREGAMTILPERMIEGDFPHDDDPDGALIGRTLAKNLHAKVGDELIFLTQARDGSMAAGIFRIRGIFRTGSPELDGFTVFVPLAALQHYLVADGMVTTVAILVDDHRHVDRVKKELQEQFPTPHWEVMSYDELMPEIMQSIAFDNASGAVFLLLLLIIIAFGILDTILMSVMERFHEFGVMMAVGMRPRAIAGMIFFEALSLGLVGGVLGNIIGYAINVWWQRHPLVIGSTTEVYEAWGFSPQLVTLPDIGQQAVWTAVVLVIALIVAMWPAWVATRFRPVEAIRVV